MENVRGEGGGERRTGGGETLNAVVCVLRTSQIIINLGGMMSMEHYFVIIQVQPYELESGGGYP